MSITVRDATESDLPRILEILNDAIANTTAVWSWTPLDLANRQAWLAARRQRGFPVLVATDESGVLGYASYGPFRDWDGYAQTVEHSVYVDSAARGRGLGRGLLQALIIRAQEAGLHVMIGGIDASNTVSIRLHESLGFTETARMPQVGRKFDRWLDLVFLQKQL